jgi:hypothetical protein
MTGRNGRSLTLRFNHGDHLPSLYRRYLSCPGRTGRGTPGKVIQQVSLFRLAPPFGERSLKGSLRRRVARGTTRHASMLGDRPRIGSYQNASYPWTWQPGNGPGGRKIWYGQAGSETPPHIGRSRICGSLAKVAGADSPVKPGPGLRHAESCGTASHVRRSGGLRV